MFYASDVCRSIYMEWYLLWWKAGKCLLKLTFTFRIRMCTCLDVKTVHFIISSCINFCSLCFEH